ncbi:MAG: hypothetical protein AAF701_03400, partial [Pseudomonadota bacterium]
TGNMNKSEAHIDLTKGRYSIDTTYSYLQSDVAGKENEFVSELTLNAQYRVQDDWTLSTNFRYDFEEKEMARSGLGIRYQNECIAVNFTVSRTAAVRTINDYGLTVELLGFGLSGNAQDRPRKTCRG